jgi:predicted PurR-regulated permease PerM
MDKFPLTVRRSIELLGIIGLCFLISVGKNILMPLLLASFIALMLMPVHRWLRKRGVPNFVAILLSLLLLIIVVGGIGVFLSVQIAGLLDDFPTMKANLNAHWQTISNWIAGRWHIPIKKQLAIVQAQTNNLGDVAISRLEGTVSSVTNIFIFVGLVPIYVFMIMFYRAPLREFIFLWFRKEHHANVNATFVEAQVMTKYYLVSLLIQITYLTVLLGGSLSLFGIKHALLIGIAFGILNLIPYIGALIGNLLGVLITLTSSQDMWQIWVVLGTIAVVQFFDNNILMPRIVGSRIKINSLASIVGIVVGNSLAGISGMFLSIPVMAVLKIVFEKSPSFRQWAVLLSEPDNNKKPETQVGQLKRNLEEKRDEEIERDTDQ